jgi:hypothetical protein
MHRAPLALLTVAASLAVPGVASAASYVDIYDASIASESESLGSYSIDAHDVVGLVDLDVDIKSKATWTGNLSTHVGYNDANVRQGAPLTVTRMSPFQTGKLKVTWTVGGTVKPIGFGTKNLGSFNVVDEASCHPALLGSAYTCTAAAPAVNLVKTPGLPGSPYVKLALQAKFKVTPEGAIVSRSFSVGGSPAAPAKSLGLSPAIDYETLTVPCAPVGSGASYRFGSFKYTPTTKVTQQPHLTVGLMDPVLGVAELPALYDTGIGGAITTNPVFELAGGGHTTDLGELKANNVAPTLAPLDAFSGKAGVPVTFGADADGRCAIESYVWKFSNGTTSYGAAPQRTFAAAGQYDGELTVTDASGLKATRNFTVTITK